MLAVTWRGREEKKKKAFHNYFLSLGEILLLAAVKAASWQLLWKGLNHKGSVLPMDFGTCSQPLPNQLPGNSFFIIKTRTFRSSKTSDTGGMSSCPRLEEAAAMLSLVAPSKGTAVPGHPQHKLNGLTQRQDEEEQEEEEEESSGISFPGVHAGS